MNRNFSDFIIPKEFTIILRIDDYYHNQQYDHDLLAAHFISLSYGALFALGANGKDVFWAFMDLEKAYMIRC